MTSLASLGTGLPPGQHGMVGYTSRVPSTGEILNALTWESDLVARAYQPKPTLFERAVEAGVSVSSVALERFESSGLTEAGLRGPDVRRVRRRTRDRPTGSRSRSRRPRSGASGRWSTPTSASSTTPGTSRDAARRVAGATWSRIDAMLERLREALPDDVVLIVTG